MLNSLLLLAAGLQALAVAYALWLLTRRRAAAGAWLCLLGAMLSMLVWRLVIVVGISPPPFFNPAIAIWGSTCMFAAMFLFGREVARRERAEQERDSLLESERLARTEAERASSLKDDFLATLSHELRTPLTAVLGWCALARLRGEDRAELDRALDTIERNTRVQVRLVDDLLDVTRLQAGSLHLDVEPILFEGPILAAIDAVRPAADAKQVALEYAVTSGSRVVMGDAARLQQVASNLLVNAVKFTHPGGRIDVRVEGADDRVRLIVADNGEGIDEAFLPYVFARFRQADSSVARSHGGLGLGLSIARDLVRLHGGQLTVASDGIGRGATFTVSIPAAARAEDRNVRTVEHLAGPRCLAGLRVLVIDDEEDVRVLVARMLERSDASVAALRTGAEATTIIREFRPDVLVVDIGMPGEDGYALMRRIRAMPASDGGRTPAISLTAHARNEDRVRALASGFQAHLAKPINFDLLTATILELARSAVADATADFPGRSR